MGSRKNWPKELADRCNAVGWAAAIQKSGHYRAFLPDGRSFGWAASTSDTNGYKNAQREAARMGLDQLEQELRLRREKERLQRIELDRAQNGVPENRMLAPEPAPKKEDENVTKYGTIEVDGVKVGIADVVKPVRHVHPRGGEVHELSHCRELLLVDETLRYQCLKLVKGDQVCARHFATSAGLVVHWNRSTHLADAEPKETRNLGPSAEPNPVEPRPGPTKEETRTPVAVYTTPDPQKIESADLAVPTGLVAQAVHQVERLRILESTLDDLAEQAGSIASELERIVEKLPEELVSPELQAKAEKFDRMMGALGQ